MLESRRSWQNAFLDRHRLESAYLLYAERWFTPLAEALASQSEGRSCPLLVAVNGCQGSGKTTLCDYLCSCLQARCGLRSLALSLDDFYMTLAERRALATSVHPLFATRGVPGTHDINLLNTTLDALLAPVNGSAVAVPRFDKARDERRRSSHWDQVQGHIDIVLLEGWCLGARPESAGKLREPINELERREDPDGVWRGYVNATLERDFVPLYSRCDQWLMLQAPSFDCVYRWRLEQEHKLANAVSGNAVMSDEGIARFIQHYQRLTDHCLDTMPAVVDYLFTLDAQRRIITSRGC